MRKIWFVKILAIVTLLATPVASLRSVAAEPTSFNDPHMQIVWERTDKPVEMFATQRSYMWGPNTLPGSPSTEPYANSPGGQRTVQYFDKSRMEVNNPSGDRTNLFFVTNGLLVREMVSGMRQFGDNKFLLFPQSQEAVAGDPATAGNAASPNYAAFRNIASLNNDNPFPNRIGQAVVEAIDKAGNVSAIASPDPSVVYAAFDTNLKHNIPSKFNDFLNQTGPVFVNGQIIQDTVINGVFLAGLPITEAFWVKAKVAGVEKDVLVQLFERRVLTYTPSNSAGFQVEMGNVGQHYLRWRYGGGPKAEERIVFHTDRNVSFRIDTMRTDGGDVKELTTLRDNFQPRWSPDNQRIVFTTDRDGNFEIYTMKADGSDQRRLTVTSGIAEAQPDWSADGSRIFFIRERASGLNLFDIWSMAADGGDQKQLTNTPGFDNGLPRSSPDGQKIAFGSSRAGDFEVFTMNVDGSNATRLTNRPTTDDLPTDWKGNTILFESLGGTTEQIWKMGGDGGSQTKVSGDLDREGAFSPDLQRIVFSRAPASGAAQDIFTMNADGSNAQKLTNTTAVFNRFADWSN